MVTTVPGSRRLDPRDQNLEERSSPEVLVSPESMRNRDVQRPGARGGHFRRVWSPRLHKFYIKYGSAPESHGEVKNREADATGPAYKEDEGNAQELKQRFRKPDPHGTRHLEEGIFQKLLHHVQFGEPQESRDITIIPVSFGDITPLRAEIIANDKMTKFTLLNKRGEEVDSQERKVPKPEAQAQFVSFMAAEYVTREYVRKTTEKSLSLRVSAHEIPVADELRKALLMTRLKEFTGAPDDDGDDNVEFSNDAFRSLEKSVRRLENDTVRHSMDADDSRDSRLEKAGMSGGQPTASRYSGRRFGHVGSGRKSARLPGRPIGSSKGASMTSADMPFSDSSTPQPRPKAASAENWQHSKAVRVGSFVLVQHPHRHETPIWARVISLGNHGVCVQEDDNQQHYIRWADIHKAEPPVESNRENTKHLAALSIPVDGLPKVPQYLRQQAEDRIRQQGIPLSRDQIHAKHSDRVETYSHLIESAVPVDHIEATTLTTPSDALLDPYKRNIIQQALAQQLPIVPELLEKLPLEKIVEVLSHHFQNKNT